jgi:hypothetical protein
MHKGVEVVRAHSGLRENSEEDRIAWEVDRGQLSSFALPACARYASRVDRVLQLVYPCLLLWRARKQCLQPCTVTSTCERIEQRHRPTLRCQKRMVLPLKAWNHNLHRVSTISLPACPQTRTSVIRHPTDSLSPLCRSSWGILDIFQTPVPTSS